MAFRATLDEIDCKLLRLLQEKSDRPLNALGEIVGLSPSAVQRRLERLRSAGIIEKQVAIIDERMLGEIVRACVLVTLEKETKALHAAFQQRMMRAKEVQQCYGLSGEWDYLVLVVETGIARCRDVLDGLFLGAPNVKRYDTSFVFDTVKTGLRLPIRRFSNQA